MSERFATHQVAHLFVLVGANPLPNYVAARLLIGTKSHLHLVVTKQTEGVGGRLREALKQYLPTDTTITLIPPVDDPFDTAIIDMTIQGYLEKSKRIPIVGKIGLHYTSGTKPMALQLQQTLLRWCDEQPNSELSLSYLDPLRLSLRFETGEVRLTPQDCTIPFAELLKLHGAKKQSGTSKPELPTVCYQLAHHLAASAEALAEWREWCDRNLRTWQGLTAWEESWRTFAATGQGTVLVEWVARNQDHLKVLQAWAHWSQSDKRKEKKADLSWVKPHVALDNGAADLAQWRRAHEAETGWTDSKDGFKKMAEFLDGKWLESYVLACIQSVDERCDLHSVEQGVEVEREVQSNDKQQPATFEFDVVAMRGYQLFAISCGTDTRKGLNKSKLFEIYARARQMGGDEARFGLVCGAEDAEEVRREIEAVWQAPNGSVRVFGRQDWATLSDRLQEWFLD